MQILIKTLHGKQFKRDLDLDMTVQEFKEKIEKDEGKEYPVEHQKLIYEGKILVNSNKLSDYNIDEKKFMVLMIVKPPPVAKKVNNNAEAAQQTVQARTVKDEQDAKTIEKESNHSNKATNTTPTRPSTRSSTAAEASNQSAPSTRAASQRSQPPPAPGSTPVVQQQLTRSQQPQPARPSLTASIDNDSQLAASLANLTSRPHFAAIQQTIQQNPHLLNSMIESLSASDPELHNFISENPDLFLNALSAIPSNNPRVPASVAIRQSESGGRIAAGNEPVSLAHMLPSATDHDRQAIERLKELGFSEFQAIQAYLACEKDEQLAANLLFQMEQ